MDKYEGFTWQLATVDAIPVILFVINSILISLRVSSILFWIGAVLCAVAGLCKVIWKFIVAFTRKDIRLLFVQMRILMPIGFILMIIGLILAGVDLKGALIGMPQAIFFLLCAIGYCLMLFCAFHDNKSDAKSNWKEQIINSLSQLMLTIGLLIM